MSNQEFCQCNPQSSRFQVFLGPCGVCLVVCTVVVLMALVWLVVGRDCYVVAGRRMVVECSPVHSFMACFCMRELTRGS